MLTSDGRVLAFAIVLSVASAVICGQVGTFDMIVVETRIR